VISGGLLGISRRWWAETGGYDVGMMGWGGENLDQSLRVWLCGGEIVIAQDSQVAHMWRSGDRRTAARYKHVGDTIANRARAVFAWYGEFAEKLSDFPAFETRTANRAAIEAVSRLPWYGNISNILAVRDRLQCRPFAWFLRRFKFIYEDGGLLPAEVFMLREERTGKCLRFQGRAGTASGGVSTAVLRSCNLNGSNPERLFWHRGNRKLGVPGSKPACCSGLRAWNTDQCLQDIAGKKFKTSVCDISGRDIRQHWTLRSTGELHLGELCGGVDQKGALRKRTCSSFAGIGSRWTKQNLKVPIETKLYLRARESKPEMFARSDEEVARLAGRRRGDRRCGLGRGCLHLLRPGAGDECLDAGMEWVADKEECFDFRFEASATVPAASSTGQAAGQGWGELHSASDTAICLDRWNDEDVLTWGLADCHHGTNQQLRLLPDEGRVCDADNQCLHYRSAAPGKE